MLDAPRSGRPATVVTEENMHLVAQAFVKTPNQSAVRASLQFFIKNTLNVIGHEILNFINTSLEYGIFPKNLEPSLITPIPKITNARKISDFKPINTLPCVEKILGRAVYSQESEYFNRNKLFWGNQSSFRKHHFCETAILYNGIKMEKSNRQGKLCSCHIF